MNDAGTKIVLPGKPRYRYLVSFPHDGKGPG